MSSLFADLSGCELDMLGMFGFSIIVVTIRYSLISRVLPEQVKRVGKTSFFRHSFYVVTGMCYNHKNVDVHIY